MVRIPRTSHRSGNACSSPPMTTPTARAVGHRRHTRGHRAGRGHPRRDAMSRRRRSSRRARPGPGLPGRSRCGAGLGRWGPRVQPRLPLLLRSALSAPLRPSPAPPTGPEQRRHGAVPGRPRSLRCSEESRRPRGHGVLQRQRRHPGRELWKSDGTDARHRPGQEHQPERLRPSPGSSPRRLVVVGETLFFSASDGTRGRELWKTDGTRAGTVLVKNIHPTHSGAPQRADRTPADSVLHCRRRHARRGALEVRRHQDRHDPGQEHRTRKSRDPDSDPPT